MAFPIFHCLNRPDMLRVLIESCGAHVDVASRDDDSLLVYLCKEPSACAEALAIVIEHTSQ